MEEVNVKELFLQILKGEMNSTYGEWQNLNNEKKYQIAKMILEEPIEVQKDILENIKMNSDYFHCEVETFVENVKDRNKEKKIEINGEDIIAQEAALKMREDPIYSTFVSEAILDLINIDEEEKSREFIKKIYEFDPIIGDVLEKTLNSFLLTIKQSEKKGGSTLELFKEKILKPIDSFIKSKLFEKDLSKTIKEVAKASVSISKQLSESIPPVLDPMYDMEKKISIKEIEVIMDLNKQLSKTSLSEEIKKEIILLKYKNIIEKRKPGENMKSFFEFFCSLSGQGVR